MALNSFTGAVTVSPGATVFIQPPSGQYWSIQYHADTVQADSATRILAAYLTNGSLSGHEIFGNNINGSYHQSFVSTFNPKLLTNTHYLKITAGAGTFNVYYSGVLLDGVTTIFQSVAPAATVFFTLASGTQGEAKHYDAITNNSNLGYCDGTGTTAYMFQGGSTAMVGDNAINLPLLGGSLGIAFKNQAGTTDNPVILSMVTTTQMTNLTAVRSSVAASSTSTFTPASGDDWVILGPIGADALRGKIVRSGVTITSAAGGSGLTYFKAIVDVNGSITFANAGSGALTAVFAYLRA